MLATLGVNGILSQKCLKHFQFYNKSSNNNNNNNNNNNTVYLIWYITEILFTYLGRSHN